MILAFQGLVFGAVGEVWGEFRICCFNFQGMGQLLPSPSPAKEGKGNEPLVRPFPCEGGNLL